MEGINGMTETTLKSDCVSRVRTEGVREGYSIGARFTKPISCHFCCGEERGGDFNFEVFTTWLLRGP